MPCAALLLANMNNFGTHSNFSQTKGMRHVTETMVFAFLSFLAHERGRTHPTLSVHLAALNDPIVFGGGIEMDSRKVSLLKISLLHQNAPIRPSAPTQSLQKLLKMLQDQAFVHPNVNHRLVKALFFTVLTAGLRSSQLWALTRFPVWTSFAEDDTHITLSLSPAFVAKNEREDFRLHPIHVEALMDNHHHHHHQPLYPVAALRDYEYIRPTHVNTPLEHLFTSIYPSTAKPLSWSEIAARLCGVIEATNTGRAPKTHKIRGLAASLTFMRTHSLYQVLVLGGWCPTVQGLHCVP